jgi:hypothetical protein
VALALALAFPVANGFGGFVDELSREREGYLESAWLDERYCGAGMRFLREAGIEGNLFNPFNLGGFLGYWLAPGLRTFIDGRLDHIPPQVLRDYLDTRNASRWGPARTLRVLLDEREVDVFFGVSFPATTYRGRESITYLRRLPQWILVFPSRFHSIYLRRSERNRRNLERVAAYYLERGVPFDPERGVDVAEILARAPDWARRQGLLPPDYAELLRQRHSQDLALRRRALERLGELYWRIGNFHDEIPIDRELLVFEPEAREPRRRLADALLQSGRPLGAIAVARPLYEAEPNYEDIAYIYTVAMNLAGARTGEESGVHRDTAPPER